MRSLGLFSESGYEDPSVEARGRAFVRRPRTQGALGFTSLAPVFSKRLFDRSALFDVCPAFRVNLLSLGGELDDLVDLIRLNDDDAIYVGHDQVARINSRGGKAVRVAGLDRDRNLNLGRSCER